MNKMLTFFCAVLTAVSAPGEVTDVKVTKAAVMIRENPKVVVIDVRTPEEFAQGHIKGAMNLNMKDEGFEKKLAKLDRKKIYLMHCASGGRSTQCLPVWDRLGFENVKHLKAGFAGWRDAGLPVEVPAKK